MQKKSKNKGNYQKVEKRHWLKREKVSKNLIKQNAGITLLALCITIIVIIILASITIGAISGDNGILGNAGKAKEDTEISNEKEIISVAVVQAMGKNKRGDLEEGEFQNELDEELEERLAEVTLDTEDYGFFVKFETSGRIYKVDIDGNVEYLGIESELITQADITATPEINTTPELTQTVELTIETPILIEGAEYSLVYAWSKDKENAPEDSKFTEKTNLEGTGRIRKATVNSNDTEAGNYYLWVRIVVGDIEKEKCFGPYAIKDHSTLAQVANNENTSTSGFLGSKEKNENVVRGKIEKIEIVTTKAGHSVEDENCWDVSQNKDETYLAWYKDEDGDGFYEITIGGEGGVVANGNSSNLFANIGYGVEDQEVEIIGLENLDTELVNNMSYMFSNCKVKDLNLSKFNTNSVTDMQYMFYYCSNLNTLDLNNFETKNVILMDYMFSNCGNLVNLKINKFNTDSTTHMNRMFNECKNLKSLDINNFNVEKVINMAYMFNGCSNLEELDLSKWNTKNLNDTSSLFSGCTNLKKLDIRKFDMTNINRKGGEFARVPNDCNIVVNQGLFEWMNENGYSNFRNITIIDV